jgi:hypothetical protein
MNSRENIGEIERLAYRLWEKEGRPHGHALTYWLKAEKMLSDEAFLEQELDTEVAEGGLVPKVRGTNPLL